MAFTQTLTVKANSADTLINLLEEWHRDQKGAAPGYEASRLLADQDRPGRYVVEVDFADEDGARRNNDRAETQAWAQKLQQAAEGDPEYANYTVAYRSE